MNNFRWLGLLWTKLPSFSSIQEIESSVCRLFDVCCKIEYFPDTSLILFDTCSANLLLSLETWNFFNFKWRLHWIVVFTSLLITSVTKSLTGPITIRFIYFICFSTWISRLLFHLPIDFLTGRVWANISDEGHNWWKMQVILQSWRVSGVHEPLPSFKVRAGLTCFTPGVW